METVHWIGLHIQYSISGVGKVVKWQNFLQKTKNTSEPQNQFVESIQIQFAKEWKFYRKCLHKKLHQIAWTPWQLTLRILANTLINGTNLKY